MSYYNICEHCGSNLDPGEKCDCMEQQEEKEIRMKEKVFCYCDENENLKKISPHLTPIR